MTQQIWTDRDLLKFSVCAGIIGFAVGVCIGYEWAWRPFATTFKPLVG